MIRRHMQSIGQLYTARQLSKRPVISLGFFPPKTAEGDKALLEKHIPALRATQPDYCSVTYGGAARGKRR